MINAGAIATIEALLTENTPASLTYAALECRLAIERICYERVRIAHDYISHDDLKRWQPRDIVNILIQEVDRNIATSYTLHISEESRPLGSPEPTEAEYQAMEFLPVGTHVGFDPGKLGRLWNALAHSALHMTLPTNKNDGLSQYGDTEKIRSKVQEALDEIKRIDSGTLIMGGLGEELSFTCVCGTLNKRRRELLQNKQVVSCCRRGCNETYEYEASSESFGRRAIYLTCKICGHENVLQKKLLEELLPTQHGHILCEECGDKIHIYWQAMQGQDTGNKD